ncbi:MAG: right-handed parallel beta-helix repeat-containing protein, partial [Candidatus Bipolaricaulota bacterium]|nr:right-handed parallel beta-helix repeat-containing protein [Candidatus Bipolaricaulota bacterium]
FITDDSPGRVYIALKNNQIHFWHIGFSAFSLGHKGWSRADALLIGNTITFNKGPGVLLGGDTIAELKENIISDNDDYGVTLFLPPCASISSGEITAFRGRMYGKDNVITNNKRGDLCPPDYPWPSGFRK